ncbi:MAG: DUF4013 domain-containing protein [Planctomycetota bacterium]
MTVDPHAAGLYVLQDPAWRDELRRGGRILLLPLVGWPMLLGYRRAQVEQFFGARTTAMPRWRGAGRAHLTNGLKAVAVIACYTAPVSTWLAATLASRGYAPGALEGIAGLAVALAPILLPLALPLALGAYATETGGPALLTLSEASGCGASFALAVFLIPAGFLRVTRTGRFTSALALQHVVPFVFRNIRDYLRAWGHSLAMNGAAFAALPIAPWAVFWGYVASVALFNQLLLDEEDPDREGWLGRSTCANVMPEPATGRIASADGEALVVRTPWFTVPRPGAPTAPPVRT